MTTTQLRRYHIADGQMEVFLPVWNNLVDQREKFGFRVAFAYVDITNNDMVWAVEHDGDFTAAERAYFGSKERADAMVGAPMVIENIKLGFATRAR